MLRPKARALTTRYTNEPSRHLTSGGNKDSTPFEQRGKDDGSQSRSGGFIAVIDGRSNVKNSLQPRKT
jgi:hypothetical protein